MSIRSHNFNVKFISTVPSYKDMKEMVSEPDVTTRLLGKIAVFLKDIDNTVSSMIAKHAMKTNPPQMEILVVVSMDQITAFHTEMRKLHEQWPVKVGIWNEGEYPEFGENTEWFNSCIGAILRPLVAAILGKGYVVELDFISRIGYHLRVRELSD